MEEINKKKFHLRIIMCIAIILPMFLGVIYATNSLNMKGELNGDGKVDYEDVKLLEKHLIHLQELPEEKRNNADMNNDGKITVTDLSLLIEKVETELDYKVVINNIEVSNTYPTKNEEIKLIFNTDINYGGIAKSITINGNEYELTNSETDGKTYEISINVGETSGVKTFTFEKVTLTNGRDVKVNNVVKVDVLKDKPTITNFTHTEVNGDTIIASFKLNDVGNTITNGSIIVEDEDENEIKRETLTTTKNNISFDKTLSEYYVITIIADYDLDSNKLETGKNEYTNQILLSETIGTKLERKFEMKDITQINVYYKSKWVKS